jgi:hypothetical protein
MTPHEELEARLVRDEARLAFDEARIAEESEEIRENRLLETTSLRDAQPSKGPLIARCPAGTRVVSGGAAVRGAARGVALVANAPDGDAAWMATAVATTRRVWRLVVTAVCATGGG